MRKCKTKFTMFSLLVVFAMCFSSVNVFAAESSDEGFSYIEFTITEDSSIKVMNQTDYEKVTVLPEWFQGKEIVSQGNLLTASAKGDNMGITVSVQLKVKGLFNQFYNVSGAARTLQCNGQTHNLYNGFGIQSGKTYRFYYKANGTNTQCPSVGMSIVIWSN